MNVATVQKTNTAVEQKKANPMITLRTDLEKMAPEFVAVLPPQISIESFTRVVLTALQTTVGLAECTPKSIWNACMRAAADGLLPDGREGAIVPYSKEASWLPMVGGIRKKIFQSGKVATLMVEVVREKDEFDHQEGDKPFIFHRKYMGKESAGEIIGVYSIAVMKDGGEVSREVMSIWEIEQVRKSSRGTNTPWNNPAFYPEMAKKTVVKRHSKSLPTSKEMVDFVQRDDEDDGIISPVERPTRPKITDFTDVEQPSDKPAPGADAKPKPEPKTDKAAAIDQKTGEVTEGAAAYGVPEAFEDGATARSLDQGKDTYPSMIKDSPDLIDAFQQGWAAEDERRKDAKS